MSGMKSDMDVDHVMIAGINRNVFYQKTDIGEYAEFLNMTQIGKKSTRNYKPKRARRFITNEKPILNLLLGK